MKPPIRISGHGSLVIITMHGLTAGQCELLRTIIQSSTTGAAFIAAPSASSEPVLCGTPLQLYGALHLLAPHRDFGPVFSETVLSLLDNYLRSDYKIDCNDVVLELGSRTHVMGILNVTPDSFSDGGRYVSVDEAVAHAHTMIAAGADIIDIGGESTRPGSLPVSEDEELSRVIPVIERLSQETTVPLSIDTYKAVVAKKALKAGASVVNDISGLRFSSDMARVAADHNAAVIIMHIKGTPRDMQQNAVYDDVVGEVMEFLGTGIDIAKAAGINAEKIMIDPGIGFGKTMEHNLTLLRKLDEFKVLGKPIVIGTSRKKFIGTVLDVPVAEDRIDGTAATVALAIERGAQIIRVHDVARMKQVAKMTDAIVNASTEIPSSK